MSLTSLGVAALGLLKAGGERALHIATFGLLRSGATPPEEKFIQPGTYTPHGSWARLSPVSTETNNTVLLLVLTDLF